MSEHGFDAATGIPLSVLPKIRGTVTFTFEDGTERTCDIQNCPPNVRLWACVMYGCEGPDDLPA